VGVFDHTLEGVGLALEARVFTYEAELEWRGGRHAEVTSGTRPALGVMPPPDFPAGDESSWSPEHLFLASIQSCTMLSFVAHCAHNGLELVTYRSQATGSLSRNTERRYAFQSVSMLVYVRMAGGHAAAARELTPKAERDCFISASTTAEVTTDWRIIE
jgi:organic hydroperoxide reductase OsmC/OhrA